MARLLVLLLLAAAVPAWGQTSYAPYSPYVPYDPFGWEVSGGQKVLNIDWSTSGNWDYYTGYAGLQPIAATAPTLDCKLSSWSGTGDLTCTGSTGGTGTLGGNPTTANSVFYPSGFSSSPATWATLDGSGDRFSFGDVLSPSGDFTICATVAPATVSGFKTILCKKTDAAKGPFCLYLSSASAVLTTNKDASTATTFTVSSAVQANAVTSLCFAYDYVGATNSIIDASVNGSDGSAVSNAVGPPMTAAVPLVLGQYSDLSADTFSGSIYRVTYWSGWAASSTELIALSKSQMGMIPAKGSALTVTRASIQSCVPTSTSSLYYVGNGMPCITQYGLAAWGAGGNKLPKSEDSTGWATSNASNARDVTAPDGAATSATTTTVSSDGDARSTSQDFTATAAVTSCSAWLKSGTASTADLGIYQTDFKATSGAVVVGDCTIATSGNYQHVSTTANWCRVRISTTSALSAATATMYLFPYAATGQTAAQTIVSWGWQCEAASYAGPYYPTTGTAATWPTTAISLANPLSTVGAFVVREVFTAPATLAGSTNKMFVSAGTFTGANSWAISSYGTGVLVYTYDSGALEYKWTTASVPVTAGVENTFYMVYKHAKPGISYMNGTATSSYAGTGTDVLSSMPTTIYIANSHAGTASLGGYVKSLKMCKGKNYTMCK